MVSRLRGATNEMFHDTNAERRATQDHSTDVPSSVRGHHSAQDQLQAREAKADLESAASVALRRAHRVVQTERRRGSSGRLGFSQIDYGRLFHRDQWTMFAIARELGCSVDDLLPPTEPTGESRVAWSDLVAASEAIFAVVQTMPDQRRSAIVLYSAGLGPRQILKRLPGRLAFSVAEDVAEGIGQIASRAESHVWTLARSDHKNFIVVKRPARC